jgi:hypothetical protein
MKALGLLEAARRSVHPVMWRRRDRRRARYKERILQQLRAAPDRWLDPADIGSPYRMGFPQEALENYDILQELVEDGPGARDIKRPTGAQRVSPELSKPLERGR